MKVVGADLSSRTIALVMLCDTSDPVAAKFIVGQKNRDRADICRSLFQSVHQWLKMINPDALFIEEPVVAGARNIRSTLLIAQVCGSLMAATAGTTRVCPTYLVPVSSWKKAVVGHGGADKPRVAEYIRTTEPTLARACGTDQDLLDASCVALYGRGLLQNLDGLRSGLLGDTSSAGLAG